MSCSNCPNPGLTCGEIIQTPCIEWEISDDIQTYLSDETNHFSSDLSGESCAILSDVLDDIYAKFKIIDDELDFSGLSSVCLEESDDTTLKGIITVFDVQICSIVSTLENLNNICNILDKDISDCDIDYSCFTTDSCDNPITITTLKDLLQTMINKICTLEGA